MTADDPLALAQARLTELLTEFSVRGVGNAVNLSPSYVSLLASGKRGRRAWFSPKTATLRKVLGVEFQTVMVETGPLPRQLPDPKDS